MNGNPGGIWNLHSTMASINRPSPVLIPDILTYLHSTMASINPRIRSGYTVDDFIYIPLWHLLIGGRHIAVQVGRVIYIPLWHLLILSTPTLQNGRNGIYIPLWHLLIRKSGTLSQS